MPEIIKPRNVRNKFSFLSEDWSINSFNAADDLEFLSSSIVLNSRNACAFSIHSIRPSVLSTGRT